MRAFIQLENRLGRLAEPCEAIRGLPVCVACALDDQPRGRQALADVALRAAGSI